MACCFWQVLKRLSKLFANHNALGQLTNHNTFRFSEGRPSSNPELIEPFVPGWGEKYCNNVNYVENNAIFKPPSTRACSSTPPKQNQDFVKEHNRTPLKKSKWSRKTYLYNKCTVHIQNYPDIITVYDHEGTLKAAFIIFTLVQCIPVSKSTAEGWSTEINISKSTVNVKMKIP